MILFYSKSLKNLKKRKLAKIEAKRNKSLITFEYVNNEFIKESFKKHNWLLISEYKNSCSPITVICDNNHISVTTYKDFIKNLYCHDCQNTTIIEYNEYDYNKCLENYLCIYYRYINDQL